MTDLENRISAIEDKLDTVLKALAAFNIDKQFMIQREEKIKSGVGCKLAYNNDGLIVGSQPLTPTDIPNLPISKINGLEETIEQFITSNQLGEILSRIDRLETPTRTVKTGTKINVDSRGLVTDVSDLLEEDIPNLPIEKIIGLREQLDILKLSDKSSNNVSEEFVKPGLGCKVEYDNMGRVLRTHELQEEDIPHTIITRLNNIESVLGSKASTEEVQTLVQELNKKADRLNTKSGIYHSVQVNSDGLVVNGYPISLDDLPDIPINKVSDLKEVLSNLASHETLVNLQNELATFDSKVNTLQNQEVRSTSNIDNSEILSKLEELNARINNIIADKSVNDEINSIKSEIATIGARLNSINK